VNSTELRATDVLANERTFLAYVRTALAFIAFGFVIARFALFEREMSFVVKVADMHVGSTSAVLGPLMSVVGVLIGAVGAYRYASTDRALRQGGVQALSPALAYAGAVAIAIIGIVVAVSIWPQR
jgi:putative membrane protein